MDQAFTNLQGHRYMNLTTFRRSGAAVVTPVWFVATDTLLYCYSAANAGKVRRIRAGGRVLLGPCTASGQPLGPPAEGLARLLGEGEWQIAYDLLRRKYRWQFGLLSLLSRLRRGQRAYIEVRPV